MASAWGLSWAGSWSNSWGTIAEPQPAAGGGGFPEKLPKERKRHPPKRIIKQFVEHLEEPSETQKQQAVIDFIEKRNQKQKPLEKTESLKTAKSELFAQEDAEILETYLQIEQQEALLLFKALGLPIF